MTTKLPSASNTAAGVLTTDAQTITGTKTFNGNTVFSAVTVSGQFNQDTTIGSSQYSAFITNHSSNGRGLLITLDGHSSVNREILSCVNSGGMVFEVDGNGNINNGSSTLHTGSDIRLKENIEPVSSGLDAIKKLNVVSFNYKLRPDERQVGLIAQEVEEILPEVVRKPMPDKTEVDNKDAYSYYNIKYNDVFMIAIKAIQEQQVIIEDLKEQIAELKAKGG